jgi:tetratricopeptide (TPR) repeat protein
VADREGATAISLQSLTAAEAIALFDGLVEPVDLSGELRREIVRTADGNPFFLEEIVLQMVDTGVLVRERDRWRASADTAAIALPDTVHGVIAARIDTLAGEDKRVLQEAAVIGRRFWLEPLARLLGELPVTNSLRRLEERGLVVARPTLSLGGQAEYQFKHALVRDVAYAGLPKTRRARAHAEHAAWLEELARDRREELAELVAAHYASALVGEDADLVWADDPAGWQSVRTRGFEALIAAGDAARRRFAISRALELHEQALGLASAEPLERARALAALGDDHEAAYHGDEAFEAYLPALDLLRGESAADPLRAHICLMASRMAAVKCGFRSKQTPDQWDGLVGEGLAAAGDDETHAWLTVLKGNVGVRRVKLRVDDPLSLDERLRFAEAGLHAAERLDRPAVLSQSYRTAGLLHSLAGGWDRTLELARRDIQRADRLDPPEQAVALFCNALVLMEVAGEFSESAGYAERSLELARGLTPHERMHGTYTVMHSRYHLGAWSELDALASDHVAALLSEPGIGCPYARAGHLFAALALAHQGRLDRAAELASTFTPDLEKPALPEALFARYLVARGEAAAGRDLAEQIVGRPVLAEENAYEILAMFEALVALADWEALAAFLPRADAFSEALALVAPASDRAAGLVSAAAGDPATADDCLTRALKRFEQLGVVFEAALTKERLAALLPNGRAAPLRREALTTYKQLEAAPHAERLQAASRAPARRH